MRMLGLLFVLLFAGCLLVSCAGRAHRVGVVSVRKNDKHLIVSLPRLRQ